MMRVHQVFASPKNHHFFKMTEACLSRVPETGASALCCSVKPCGGASVSGLGSALSLFTGTGMEKQLIRRFKSTFTTIPDWAWDFKPSIPLIGQQYKPGKGLLIYASAEMHLRWQCRHRKAQEDF